MISQKKATSFDVANVKDYSVMYLYTTAANAPPIKGATINTQTLANALPPTNRAGPKERAGFTEVPVYEIPKM